MTVENGAGMTNNNNMPVPSVGGLKVVPLLQLCCPLFPKLGELLC